MKSKVLVIGASGTLGQMICQNLRRFDLYVSDYNMKRGKHTAKSMDAKFRLMNVHKQTQITQAVRGMDAVIVAVKQTKPLVQEVCAEQKIHCIDVCVFREFIDLARQIHPKRSANITMSGFFPGLSGLLVKQAVEGFTEVDEVHVGLLQSTNAKAGAAGVKDMLTIIADHGFSKKRDMPFSILGVHTVREIVHAEVDYLQEKLGIHHIKYWTAWNRPSFNTLIYGLIKLRLIHLFFSSDLLLKKAGQHNPAKPEDCGLSVQCIGILDGLVATRTRTLQVPSDYETTAAFTAALTEIVITRNVKGACWPLEITTIEEILTFLPKKISQGESPSATTYDQSRAVK